MDLLFDIPAMDQDDLWALLDEVRHQVSGPEAARQGAVEPVNATAPGWPSATAPSPEPSEPTHGPQHRGNSLLHLVEQAEHARQTRIALEDRLVTSLVNALREDTTNDPLYVQLTKALRILIKELPAGTALPSQLVLGQRLTKELGEGYGPSTVHKAIRQLASARLLTTSRGCVTRVARRAAVDPAAGSQVSQAPQVLPLEAGRLEGQMPGEIPPLEP